MTETQEQVQPRAGDQNEDGSIVILVEGVEVEEVEETQKPHADRVGPGGFYKNYETPSGGQVEVLVLPSPGNVEGEEGDGAEAQAEGPATDPDAAAGQDGQGTPAQEQQDFAPGDAPN